MTDRILFNQERYDTINSRINRQKRILTESLRYYKGEVTKQNRLSESIQRSEKLKLQIIRDYFRQVAAHAIEHDIPLSLPALTADKVVDKTDVIQDLFKSHWSEYRSLVVKLRVRTRMCGC